MKIRSALLIPLLIIVIGVISYNNSFNGAFFLDDNGWLIKNIQNHNLLSHISNSTRPLVALSFFLNFRLSGRNVADYHAINLLIHIIAALLLYGIVRRTLNFFPAKPPDKLIRHLLPPFTAIIWLVHPIQTESVTYIVQRAESLMGLFFLLTLFSVIRGIESEKCKPWFVFATLSCLLGMLTKPIMVTAPLMVLLYDRTFVTKNLKESLRLRWKLYLGLSSTWLILAWLVLSPNESTSSTGFSMNSVTPLAYLAVQPGVILHYIKLIFWPKGLCLDYAWPPISTPLDIIIPSLFLLPLIILTIFLTKKRSAIGFCLAWFFIILIPSSSIIPIADFAVEHRLYLSLAGVVVIAVTGIITFIEVATKRFSIKPSADIIALSVLTIISIALMLQTIKRNRVYISNEAFCRSIISISPHNFRARTMLIKSLLDNGKNSSAEIESKKLIDDVKYALKSKDVKYTLSASRPDDFIGRAYMLHGMALINLDRLQEAYSSLEKALIHRPDDHLTLNLMATTLMGLQRYPEAINVAEKAIEISPENSTSYTLMGYILLKSSREDDAIKYFETAASIDHFDVISRLELAWLLATDPSNQIRNGKRALDLCKQVTKLIGGNNYRTLDATGAAYAANGDFKEAVLFAKRALNDLNIRIKNGTADAMNIGAVHSTPENIKTRLEYYKNKKVWCRIADETLD